MNPLFDKYFHAELTASEETALETLLQSSEEQAWQFGQAAGEIYRAYGLPESEWTGPDNASSGWGGIVLAVFLLLLVGGVSLYLWSHKGPMASGIVPAVETQPADVYVPPGSVDAVKPKTRPVLGSDKASFRAVGMSSAPSPPGSPRGFSQPENVKPGAPEKVSGNNLRIVLKQASTGPVTVSVVDRTGREVRRIYNGTLNAGHWAFEWDGKDSSGKLMSPGTYQVEVGTWEGASRRVLTIK